MPRHTPFEAAEEFHRLDVEGVPGRAASFARTYEDRASETDFSEYLRFVDLFFGEVCA